MIKVLTVQFDVSKLSPDQIEQLEMDMIVQGEDYDVEFLNSNTNEVNLEEEVEHGTNSH